MMETGEAITNKKTQGMVKSLVFVQIIHHGLI